MTERTADSSREPETDRAVHEVDAAPKSFERDAEPDTAGPNPTEREETVRLDKSVVGSAGDVPGDGQTVRLRVPGDGAPAVPPIPRGTPTTVYSGPPPPVPGAPGGPGPASWPAQSFTPPQQPPPWPGPYPPAPSGPPLPKPSGRGNTALIVFGVLAALIITGGLWALITLTGGMSPFGDRSTAAAPAPTAGAPLPGPSETPFPGPGSTADPVPSGGPTGQVSVTWVLFDVTYTAVLNTTGPTGTADVTYQSPIAGEGTVQVQQDLTLRSAGGRLAYVGSNPRDAGTGQPTANYTPDVFVLDVNDDRQVFVVQVCDLRGSCAPAAR